MDCLYWLHREDEADRDRVVALELYEKIARRSPSRVSARRSAGIMRLNTGVVFRAHARFADAVTEFDKAEQWFGPLVAEYPGVLDYSSSLATVYLCWADTLGARKDWPAAAERATRALTIWKGQGAYDAASSALTVLADYETDRGQLDDAVRDYSTAIQWVNDAVAKSGYKLWTRLGLAAAHAGRALALDRLGRYTEALTDWNKAIENGPELSRQPTGILLPGTGFPAGDAAQFASSPCTILAGKASTLTKVGRMAEAESVLRRCLALCEEAAPDAWATPHARSLLGAALLGQKKYADAEPLLVRGYQGMKARQAKGPSEGKARLLEALGRLVQLYDAWEKKAEAAKWRKELEAMKER
jgi:tetratricopeptide (TPR) repeat protein